MFGKSIIIVCAILSTSVSSGFPGDSSITKHSVIDGRSLINDDEKDNFKPLILNPYIESGKLDEARELSNTVVQLGGKKITTYTGFINVNKEYNSNMFFWYFVNDKESKNAPVIIWLQGGPGITSLYGAFLENGPFEIVNKDEIVLRETYWSQHFDVIYIDNPVGTGFSYTDDEKGYAETEEQVAQDLLTMFTRFLGLFDIGKNGIYLAGESYAGKYIPAFANAIHGYNKISTSKINLKGLFIGNGWCDPINMLNYGDLLYNLGLLDTNGKAAFQEQETRVKQLIQQGDYLSAARALMKIKGKDSMYHNFTGLDSVYNFYNQQSGDWLDYYTEYINSKNFRKFTVVGNRTFQAFSEKVYSKLEEDTTKSVAPLISKLLDHYPIVFYNGQLDITCAYTLTDNFLNKLNWTGNAGFKKAERHIYRIDGEIAGYYKIFGNLTQIMIRDAGHMVPIDQPKWAMEMMLDLIYKREPFSQ